MYKERRKRGIKEGEMKRRWMSRSGEGERTEALWARDGGSRDGNRKDEKRLV